MNALEGAAVNAASGTTNNAATENAAAVPAVSAETVPVDVVAAQAETPAAATPAETAQVDPNLQQQAQQISGLQGMGKEIAPRDSESPKAKRDLAGFDRALTFAEAALTKGPTIQLGTGEGGAGVGIIVDNNGGTVGEAAAAAAKVKRDESSQPRRRTKVTRMYVKRGVPAGELHTCFPITAHSILYSMLTSTLLKAIQTSSEFEARSVESLPVANIPAVAKRETVSSDVIDSINLNVNDDQGFTMTFVETTEDDDATTDELDE